jgi:hypothetical protein
MFGNERRAEVGDLIVQRPTPRMIPSIESSMRWIGVVYEVTDGKVFICWNGRHPPTYRAEFGYTSQNIFNLRRNFEVVKAKIIKDEKSS